MPLPERLSERFTTESGLRIITQVPEIRAQTVVEAVRAVVPLTWGDYDAVSYLAASGTQHFRSMGSGRNAATDRIVDVPCAELSFFVSDDAADAEAVLSAIYAAHPYEEPVIFVLPCLRTCHIRGTDEDNPNKFWNSPTEAWVPQEHR